MITFRSLGNYGRLGNQLFQIAATMGVAIKNREQYVFPIWQYAKDINVPTTPKEDFDLFKWHIQTEHDFTFCPEVFNLPTDKHVDLSGYFQSEKYFEHCKAEVRDAILTNTNLNTRQLLLKDHHVGTGENICAIHIRRGDYLRLQNHYINLSESGYYPRAIMEMKNAGVDVFLVVSDDIHWCMRAINAPGFRYSHCENPFDDLLMMSGCSHHIIANSSFSWWGSWLANSKRTIAPSKWFGPAITHSTKDLYRKEMELM